MSQLQLSHFEEVVSTRTLPRRSSFRVTLEILVLKLADESFRQIYYSIRIFWILHKFYSSSFISTRVFYIYETSKHLIKDVWDFLVSKMFGFTKIIAIWILFCLSFLASKSCHNLSGISWNFVLYGLYGKNAPLSQLCLRSLRGQNLRFWTFPRTLIFAVN